MAAVLLYVCSAFVVWAVLWPNSGAVLICPASCTCLGGLIDCSKKGLLSVPEDLRHCSWGTRLELQSNGITTLGPDDFKGLQQLEVLFLSNNDITFINGSVFEDLVSLHTLKITHNKLTEMPVFPSHLVIKELSLAYNMIHTITQEALQALPHLQVLYLNHNQIMDIPIGAFPSPSHLTHLYLNNNKIMRLEPGCLDNLTTLEQLKLNKNQMFELRKDIFSTLSRLRFLELSRNKISTIQGLTFKGLKNLQVLKLKRNSIVALMDGAFWGLENINNLQLDHNSIVNVTSSWLFGLSSLKHLSLTHNKIGDIQEDGWECCKQNLNTLDLTHNQLKTIYSKTFRKLAHLENLLLDHNRLSRIDDGAFDGLRDLITLEMNDNAIAWTMEDVTGAFMGLQNLVKLGLKMNHIKSIANHAFTGLASLQQLHLEDNNITAIQHDSFKPLVNLRVLRLNSTNLLCDCHLGWLAAWLRSFGFQSSVIAVCSYPQALRGKSIFDVPTEAFKCNDLEITKPVILSSPQSQNAYKGQNMTLTCTAAIPGEAEHSIQWKKDNVVLPDSMVENVATSDGNVRRYTSRLQLHNVQDSMAGHYQCVVSNKFGSNFSKKARINVYVFPMFIKKPLDITVKAGQSAKLQCSASGQPQPVISWQKDGGDDFPAARERRMYVIPKDDQFFIAKTRNVDEGVYTCRAQNEAGVITANATVTILETPDFISPMEEEKTTRMGETAVLECMASGSPRPKLQWLKDAQPLDVTPRHFFTADGQLLIIVETSWEDAGVYTCEMSNTLGIMRGNTKLRIVSSDGQRKSSRGPRGLDDESTTTGIIIIAVVCCVVGTSLVWVIIIYQTRKRHEMYSATPTDETTLPGEMPSGYSSSDKEGSYIQGPINGITRYHYQDYQLKESSYESSVGPHRSNGWTSLRPTAAIFPSDVEEDEGQDPPLSHSQQELRRQQGASSVSSLHQSGEDSDTACHPHCDAGGKEAAASTVRSCGSGAGMSRGARSLSTFHPGPTNHDRYASRSIALPSVRGETETNSVSTVTATTQTPCPNCECCDDSEWEGEKRREREGGGVRRDRCDGCVVHKQFPVDNGSNSDSNAYQHPLHPLVHARASSVTSLPSGTRPLRPVQAGGAGGCCCRVVHCNQHQSAGLPRLRQQCHRHSSNEVCVGESKTCDEAPATSSLPCSHHTCHHPVQGYQQRQQDSSVAIHQSSAPSRDVQCCAQRDTDTSHYGPPPPYPYSSVPWQAQSTSHTPQDSPSHPQHPQKTVSINV